MGCPWSGAAIALVSGALFYLSSVYRVKAPMTTPVSLVFALSAGRSAVPPTPSHHRHWSRLTALLCYRKQHVCGTEQPQEECRMTYPSAPWTLQGFAVQTLHL